jgi:catechol 2,3-dioxygenase-like lactoylglutathione lyase family enzyme
MRLRMELFVGDLDRAVAWYESALGFRVVSRFEDYVSVGNGSVVLGLGPVAKLPVTGSGPGHTQDRVLADAGAGVEIVLELDRPADVDEAAAHCAAVGVALVEPLVDRPWGLRDFRVADPDGYYIRVTHGDAGRDARGPGQ